ncbi:acetyl-CoA carboxylase biotin carboxyl carrier protein [Peptoniphilus asaccharolyticus DSM 20463]|uniref:Biotin carboxyl carrier protein of acetyl-CoA carboxylase n=1 Tax=Peptoniphilus asaccharolyticus DSM 20463 TaxID=573058 RepID=A0A1W1UXN6_PEPAS|nr:acetyl-CoA carboxylase biotin carboxyl carrier protein subunit [Peptoniphilus asaccharolyticus]MBL7575313.1 hypothetical protein [Peptoniphilus asaccharolyticus]SMB85809.1 acetyl-CoA carboxylase biotin carboxyl carrier protein [Peptoniphilus asaccharolyticus DSM 20463]
MEKYLEFTKSLLKEFDNSKTNFFEINVENYSLKLKKEGSKIFNAEEFETEIETITAKNEIKESKVENISLEEIKAPLVGVFYSAKDPESKPFATEGDNIKKGDVICILESMKMMNEIKSPFDGIIKEVCCKNEELVEFEQVLFILEKI